MVSPALRRLALLAVVAPGALAAGALLPLSAFAPKPLLLPLLVATVGVIVISDARPEAGMALAFPLLTLSPGVAGPLAWLPGAGLVGALAVLAVLRGTPEGSRRPVSVLSVALLAYSAVVVLGVLWTPDPSDALPIIRNTTVGLLLFAVLATQMRTPAQIRCVLTGVCAATVLPSALALQQRVSGIPTGFGRLDATGTVVARATAGFGHPNQLAGLLLLLLPFVLAAVVMLPRARLLWIVVVGMSVAAVLATGSRGGVLAMGVLPAVVLAQRRASALASLVALAVAASGAVVYVVSTSFPHGMGSALEGRVDIWQVAAHVWAQRPLFGGGTGSFPHSYASAGYVGKMYLPDSLQVPPPHGHNLALQVMSENGFVGLAALIAVTAAATATAATVLAGRSDWVKPLAPAAVAMLLAMFVQNQVDFTLLENNATVLFALLGLLLGAAHTSEVAACSTQPN